MTRDEQVVSMALDHQRRREVCLDVVRKRGGATAAQIAKASGYHVATVHRHMTVARIRGEVAVDTLPTGKRRKFLFIVAA